MDPQFHIIFIGLLVGTLVGLSGLGGGVLLLPLLILGAGVPPLVAVGSGAVFSALTKIGGSVMHYRRGNVDVKLGLAMSLGSIPAALAGVGLLALLMAEYGEDLNQILGKVIGILLIVIPAIMFLQRRLWEGDDRPLRDQLPRWINRYHGAVVTGLVGGFLVGITSVGSGSVIMVMLLLFYRLAPAILVGTDIFPHMLPFTPLGFAPAGKHYHVFQPPRVAGRHGGAVQGDTGFPRTQYGFARHRVADSSGNRLPLLGQPDGNAPFRNALDELARTVQWVHNPDAGLAEPGAVVHRLFGEPPFPRHRQMLEKDFIDRPVSFCNRAAAALGLVGNLPGGEPAQDIPAGGQRRRNALKVLLAPGDCFLIGNLAHCVSSRKTSPA